VVEIQLFLCQSVLALSVCVVHLFFFTTLSFLGSQTTFNLIYSSSSN
jgi:hypothetical protein